MARTAIGTNDFRQPVVATAGVVRQAVTTYDTNLDVHIWKPNTANRPALIFLHGGGWDSGSPTDLHYIVIANRFAEKGFAVFSAEYTLTGGDPQAPIDDVLTLVQWVRDNASTYNADSSRVAILGVSAGGHLGLMAGITGTTGATRPDAVCGWSPACDLEEAYSQGNGPEVLGVGGYINLALSGNEATYRLYSPTDQITSACCPIRIVGSDTEDTESGDDGLAVVQFTSMVAAAQSAGVPVASRTFTGSVHGLFTDVTPGFVGANDVAATCAWLERTIGSASVAPGRTASGGRTASSGRVAA